MPYGYFDTDLIRDELTQAGFDKIAIETVNRQSVAPSARDLAIGFCQGSPLRSEIEERDPNRLGEATDAATKALLSRFGDGPITGKMRAHLITAVFNHDSTGVEAARTQFIGPMVWQC